MNRRRLITGLVSLMASPAIVRAASLMPIHGDRYFFWEYAMPLLPDPFWFGEGQDLVDKCFSPSGALYKGIWTFFGKDRNIYSDSEIGFRKEEYPPRAILHVAASQ